jgi:hypothetical protein
MHLTTDDREIARLTARMLLEVEAVHFRADEPYRFTSGIAAPVYIDCRKLIRPADLPDRQGPQGRAAARLARQAAILVTRDRIIDPWMESSRGPGGRLEAKRVYYLSLEFLIGRLLRDASPTSG